MNLERAKSWFEKHEGRTISNREAFMMADDITSFHERIAGCGVKNLKTLKKRVL